MINMYRKEASIKGKCFLRNYLFSQKLITVLNSICRMPASPCAPPKYQVPWKSQTNLNYLSERSGFFLYFQVQPLIPSSMTAYIIRFGLISQIPSFFSLFSMYRYPVRPYRISLYLVLLAQASSQIIFLTHRSASIFRFIRRDSQTSIRSNPSFEKQQETALLSLILKLVWSCFQHIESKSKLTSLCFIQSGPTIAQSPSFFMREKKLCSLRQRSAYPPEPLYMFADQQDQDGSLAMLSLFGHQTESRKRLTRQKKASERDSGLVAGGCQSPWSMYLELSIYDIEIQIFPEELQPPAQLSRQSARLLIQWSRVRAPQWVLFQSYYITQAMICAPLAFLLLMFGFSSSTRLLVLAQSLSIFFSEGFQRRVQGLVCSGYDLRLDLCQMISPSLKEKSQIIFFVTFYYLSFIGLLITTPSYNRILHFRTRFPSQSTSIVLLSKAYLISPLSFKAGNQSSFKLAEQNQSKQFVRLMFSLFEG